MASTPRSAAVEFGIDTFGDVTLGPDGTPLDFAAVLRNVVEQAVLADRVGLQFIGVGEHHRRDFAISAPEVVLAAIASRTSSIRLGSAVTVLSSDDPVRVYERFATLDGLSGGRAEVILGRGSFTESFPLFGYDLADYEVLFAEKLDLFVALRDQQPVTWTGSTRAPLEGQSVFPTVSAPPLPTWVGVGGSPQSVVRTASYGLPMMLAIIGGDPLRFAPYAELYRSALTELGKPELPLGVHAPGYVADTDEQALAELWPPYRDVMGRIGRERGWPPMSRAEFEQQTGPRGAIFAGSPETVAGKIAAVVTALGVDRFDLKYSHGALAHDKLMRSVELYGTAVVPRVRELLAEAVK